MRSEEQIPMNLNGDRIFIRFFEETDAEILLDFQERNRDFFQKRSPIFDDKEHTIDTTKEYIGSLKTRMEKDENYTFGIFLMDGAKLIGDVSLFHVGRGPVQKCMIGYRLDQEWNGKGYTTEAVKLAVKYAFNELKLHRIEAGAMLDNIGSMRVLEKAGFQKEGIERKGVKINGAWEDHQIFSILADDFEIN